MAGHLEIVRVGYFGSYAMGRYAPGSDLDVLIEVTSTPQHRPADRGAAYRPERFPVETELFVYTSEELERLRREGSAFVAAIDREIRWVSA
jgi:predicted nucleotidyltransferase